MRKFTKKIKGYADRPRMIVTRSLSNLYVQLIDDIKQDTLLGVSSQVLKKGRANCDVAEKLGELVADKAKKMNIKKVIFDRGSHVYNGRIKKVAEKKKKKGLEF